ncbi:MAG: glycerophosphodiester phosphodiesterase [Candidatus Dormibacteraeota bacterium]|nr:glycerophosphodiester phosphodiesterase [Candidatus Dormibacteraeota bacterium]
MTALLDGRAGRPLVIAHRGASADAPENSLAAFDAAIAQRADLVELDVRRTADAQLVVHHSARRRGVQIDRLTHDELVERSRHRPPLLDEVLALCAGRVGVDVEIKEAGYESEVVAIVERRLDAAQAVVTSFHAGVIETVKSLRPELRCGLVVGLGRIRTSRAGVDRAVVDPARLCGADFIAMHQLLAGLRPHSQRGRALATSPVLKAAADAGLPVAVWTVNGVIRLRHFLNEPLVAAVITDTPATAIDVRQSLSTPSQSHA